MTITEFLLARIAEDEEAARECARHVGGAYGPYHPWEPTLRPVYRNHGKRWDPARVLAECAAKRRLVRSAQRALFPDTHRRGTFWDGQRAYAEAVLQELAAVYADHPDYDTAWSV